MTDNGRHLIVVAHVSDAVNDKQQVAQPLPWAGAVLADTGYHSAANLALCENRGLVAFIAEGREGKAVHTRCKATVETVFGMIKKVTGFRRFHLQGLRAASGEWTLVSLAWNLKRMHALAASTRLEQGIRAPGWAAVRLLTLQSTVGLSWRR